MKAIFVVMAGLVLVGGCFAGPPDNLPECGEEYDIECPSGQVCIEFVCHLVCNRSDECPAANEACISGVCHPFSGACDGTSADECPEGWFCNDSGACQKYPAEVSCVNGARDGNETDIDCGGIHCDPCGEGKTCAVGEDCASLVCGTENTCLPPSCIDEVKNGYESDVDCGGATLCARCADGLACASDDDCMSHICGAGARCAVPACNDGVQNGDESDVDCGGTTGCDRCADAQTCVAGEDCNSGVCGANHTCLAASCTDGVQNSGESDVDCGGATSCDRCPPGDACVVPGDCDSGVCTDLACATPTCSDGVHNGGESDVDCGGATSCARCPTGKSCTQAGDCVSSSCQDHQCRPPTCDDNTQNGAETDVDCGGGSCSPCEVGQGCGVDADCRSTDCRPDNTCALPWVVQVATGEQHSCALLSSGEVRCWGSGSSGQLGYGNTNNIGDDETPASAGNVVVGGTVTQIATGGFHTCALLSSGDVRCWGNGAYGKLGYGNTNNIGDDETPASAGNVVVGGTVTQITASRWHTCALLSNGQIRCWGHASEGKLGYGNSEDIGDDEAPASAGSVDVGGTVTQIAAGELHTCALLSSGQARCWGNAGYGKLGYANTNKIGDDETPASAGSVDVGGTVTQITTGYLHTCALLSNGEARCWGSGYFGKLGYGNIVHIGDDETPASAGSIVVGDPVTQIVAGGYHTCALLSSSQVRCWGYASEGHLGYGNSEDIGDDETPASAGSVNVGSTVTQLAAGNRHTCALLSNSEVRCWGLGADGRLGYGNTTTIGDDETPASAGSVVVIE